MFYVGLDVHKKTISYCVKDVSGNVIRSVSIENRTDPGADDSGMRYTRRPVQLGSSTLEWDTVSKSRGCSFCAWVSDPIGCED
jgi:hypothetical protein